jgi:hypothetical protein
MEREQQLRWEAERRPLAAAATFGAGFLTLAGGVAAAIAYRDFPKDSSSRVIFYHDHALSLLLVAIVLGIAALLLAVTLDYLFRAVKARRPELPTVARFAALFGPIAVAVGQIVQQVVITSKSADYVKTDQTYQGAKHVLEADPILAAAILRQAGVLALGFAFVIICLNAMRVGLLTRFMGVLGIIVGVLFVIPIGSPLPIVQAFWLMATGLLLAGRWPNGVPSAWELGVSVPWPSQQEAREARDRERGLDPPSPKAAAPEPVAATPDGPVHPSSKKRKRKRRR